MYRSIVLLLSLLFALTGCRSETSLTGGTPPPEEEIEEEEPDYSEFDGATLEVNSPVSGDILSLSEGQYLDALILDADGEPMDFDDIIWETDQVDGAIHIGQEGDVFLPYGIHEFTVTAELPNGDRLQTVLGGVRIQSEHTGVYAGQVEINIAIEFQGTPVNAQCVGGLDFVVDMAGEAFGGAGSCSISLVVLPGFDVAYSVNANIDGDLVDGAIGINILLFDLPIGFEGAFEGDTVYADFEGAIPLLGDLTGGIDAHRVSLYVDPPSAFE
jgi:hypothetical protein